ncbi:dethiobiotin synthetase [Methylomarinovum caldicuralii]|uniref:ATP-dependent dethiobiotin synthetase BioD n=1 Tax=Methylomarinovum caldicuralii TaxID=438856 RepID=A0AAU9C2M6_9GAMM|nr:dethiobiotin synthase [Methylomarinovum caldicuralii]BCX82652.1 dethiobiotin synthetase [Methylomarinovum caldicuralii]
MTDGLFVTGTDTGVGKTWVACRLLRHLVARGMAVQVRKPVESGCRQGDAGLVPADALALKQAAGSDEPLAAICPYRYAAAASPPRAAALVGETLQLRDLLDACHPQEARWRLVEGAGGFCSPIAGDGLNADLAAALGLAVLVVAPDRLGAVNQVLLTLEAIERRGLTTTAVFLNAIAPPPPQLNNAAELRQWTCVPVVSQIPALADLVVSR